MNNSSTKNKADNVAFACYKHLIPICELKCLLSKIYFSPRFQKYFFSSIGEEDILKYPGYEYELSGMSFWRMLETQYYQARFSMGLVWIFQIYCFTKIDEEEMGESKEVV